MWLSLHIGFVLGDSTRGGVFHGIIMDIIKRAHEIGLFVTYITHKSGESDQARWSKFWIYVKNYSPPKVRSDSSRNLYLIPDVPHII